MNLFEKAKHIALASDYVVKFGRYKNTKLIDIYQNDKEYFDWLETTIVDKDELQLEIAKLKENLSK